MFRFLRCTKKKNRSGASVKSLGSMANSPSKSSVPKQQENGLLIHQVQFAKMLSKLYGHPKSRPWGHQALLVHLECGERSPKEPELGDWGYEYLLVWLARNKASLSVMPCFSASMCITYHHTIHRCETWCQSLAQKCHVWQSTEISPVSVSSPELLSCLQLVHTSKAA